jgi:CRP-like cAMP-binding protein
LHIIDRIVIPSPTNYLTKNRAYMHPLRKHIESMVSITDHEFDSILSYFKHREIRKHQYLLQEDELCRHDNFVLTGSLRQYYVHKKREHIIQFAFDSEWISDWHSMLESAPSRYNIDALESTEILQLGIKEFGEMLEAIPKMEKFYRIISQKVLTIQQHRISYLQKPADERYESFSSLHGYYEEKVSQGQIAAYLGITRESLSRLKNQ